MSPSAAALVPDPEQAASIAMVARAAPVTAARRLIEAYLNGPLARMASSSRTQAVDDRAIPRGSREFHGCREQVRRKKVKSQPSKSDATRQADGASRTPVEVAYRVNS